MRLVLDTNVVISAFMAQGVPYELMQIVLRKHISIYTSDELLDELKVVLNRKKIASKLMQLQRHPDEIIRKFERISSVIAAPPPYPQIARDPNDDMVLACAIAAQANAIVTGDNDLLVLKQHHRIQILRPRQALQKLKFSAGFP